MRILQDADLERVPMAVLVEAIKAFVVADFEGRTTSPPRQSVDFPTGKMVFTCGGMDHLAGFRAYESFKSPQREGDDQIVAVWNTDTCVLEGACFGSRLGALRTGALGGMAVDALAPSSPITCALIGTGVQAQNQLLGILACREVAEVRVYSRHKMRRDAFVERFGAKVAMRMTACNSAEAAASGADVVVLATDASSSVIDPEALADVAHITTLGPKFAHAHELPLAAVADRLIVSDSPQQIRAQGKRHMLGDHPSFAEIRHLGEVLTMERPARPSHSLYLSAGLAGTEVVALAAALHAIA